MFFSRDIYLGFVDVFGKALDLDNDVAGLDEIGDTDRIAAGDEQQRGVPEATDE